MARILCTERLLRRLRPRPARSRDTNGPLVSGTVLGNWAATVARLKRRDLVIALNDRTYLTLLFPFARPDAFRSDFADALGRALRDHDVPRDVAVREGAEIEVARFARLTDRLLRTALDNAEFICGIEMDYEDDLREVQAALNEFPHPNREPSVPTEAVLLLFAVLAARRGRSSGLLSARSH